VLSACQYKYELSQAIVGTTIAAMVVTTVACIVQTIALTIRSCIHHVPVVFAAFEVAEMRCIFSLPILTAIFQVNLG